ncbi:MAG TPA: methyltransferase domain-containing protein [Blastocatellia bacterium]|nr:methyltransferase domain-containing protein [Blastocatellia bacterium]
MAARTIKQRVGTRVIPRLPFSRHVFNHIRLELNSLRVRALHRLHPAWRVRVRRLKQRRDLLVNVGCGPFGKEGWVNFDLMAHPNVTLALDCRHKLPLSDGSCLGIHVEHYFEHLDPADERGEFLKECRRCIQPEGVLRVIVPDAELYIRAYLEPGWGALNRIGCGGEEPEATFECKMDALNHVFHQGWEHYAGYDAESMELCLRAAGFTRVMRQAYRAGEFPGGCIDRDEHRPYSLYVEARP